MSDLFTAESFLIDLVQVTSHSASKDFIDKIPAKDKTHSSYEASSQ